MRVFKGRADVASQKNTLDLLQALKLDKAKDSNDQGPLRTPFLITQRFKSILILFSDYAVLIASCDISHDPVTHRQMHFPYHGVSSHSAGTLPSVILKESK